MYILDNRQNGTYQAPVGQSDDESEQEDAIEAAEEWVSNTCSGGGVQSDVAMALWLSGMAQGEQYLRAEKAGCVERPVSA